MCETCINRSCSKTETLLRRTDTFDHVCFLYPPFLRISNAKTVKRALLQTYNFFRSSDKKSHLPYLDKNKNFRNFRETIFFLFNFANLIECDTFESNSVSKLLSATNQQLFCVTESDIGLLNYWSH